MTFSPTPEQQAIIDHPGQTPLRVSAGAGTGKTTTIALRLEALIKSGQLEPESALGVTFTVKAAEELGARLADRLPDFAAEGRLPLVTTYHGFAFSIIQEYGGYLGFERDLRVMTPGFGRQLLFESISDHEFSWLDLTHVPSRIDELVSLAGELANHLAVPADLPEPTTEIDHKRSELGSVLTTFGAKKRELGAIDFGDMIALAHQLVADIPRVRADLRGRYRHVLLDEYQDTNAAQRELLIGLFGEGHPITAVGDVGQTIYEWRGATAANFEQFPTDFPAADGSPATRLALSTSHRSGQTILDLANKIRRKTGEADPVELTAAEQTTTARIESGWFHNAVDEANWIAQEVLRLRSEGCEDGAPVSWRDIAVLFRKNAQIDLVRQALEAEGVPVEVASIGALVHVPEVAQLHAWLQLLERGDEGGAILRILLGPRFRLGIGDVARLVRWEDESTRVLGAIEALMDGGGPEVDPGAQARLSRFWSEYRELLVVAQGLTLGDLCRRILDVTSAWVEVSSMPDAARLSARLNLYRFLDLAEQWSPLEGRPSLGAFLDYIDSLLDERTPDEMEAARVSNEDAVTLLTVHRAKGLEWDVVFLPALALDTFPSRPIRIVPSKNPGLLPLPMRADADASSPEADVVRTRHEIQEWRTAYVAATRARKLLIGTGAYYYTFKRPKQPSSLFEIIEADSEVRVARAPEAGSGPLTLSIETADAPDPLFLGGWKSALAERLESGEPMNKDPQFAEQQSVLFDLPEPPAPPSDSNGMQTSVTGLVTYATCPRKYYWSEVDRLPRRPSRRAMAGTRLHRQIELHNLGRVPLFEDVEYDDIAQAPPGKFSAFRESRFGQEKPVLIETPFLYQAGAGTVRGRIDAVYGDDDAWEIVDFKSGRSRQPGASIRQLQAYALAARAGGLGRPAPEDLEVTFAFLGDGLELYTETADEQWLARAEQEVETTMVAISEEQFDPEPSAACRSCDFARVCEAGGSYLAEESG